MAQDEQSGDENGATGGNALSADTFLISCVRCSSEDDSRH